MAVLSSFFRVLFVVLMFSAVVFAIIPHGSDESPASVPGEGSVCQSLSKTWHKRCRETKHCDKRCRQREQAEHGACHGFWHSRCYCYHKC